MKKILSVFFATIFFLLQLEFSYGQTVITMQKSGGVYVVPCTVNGLKLKFIFDTGASDVSISLTEARFMIKNEYLNKADILGSQNYLNASGEISVGTKIILRKIEFSGMILTNVEASVVNNIDAPLLFGLTAISKLGPIQLDPIKNTLTIMNGASPTPIIPKTVTAEKKSLPVITPKDKFLYIARRDTSIKDCLLWKSLDSDVETVYNIPKDSQIFVLQENIETNMNDKFCYVFCDGYYGYLEQYFIKK